jgi:non-ribosomal peptide synthetase component E (peptide arylation enzyme)
MLIDGDRTTTFAQYHDLAERAAAGYHELGVTTGSRVSWQLPTWTESAVLVGGLARLGAVQNPMLPIYRAREMGFIAEQTRCELLITPSTWNRFDYASLAQEIATQTPGLRTLVADHHNPEGDPSTLPPRPEAFDGGLLVLPPGPTTRCDGCSTHPARPPTPRVRSTPTAA